MSNIYDIEGNLITSDRKSLLNPIITGFQLTSHRGDSSKKNNTIAAFESAYNLGYKIIECDLLRTSDAVIVVYHGPNIGNTPVSNMTWEQVQAADSDIRTLSEVLLWAKKKNIVLELDCAQIRFSTAQQLCEVYDLVEDHGMLNSVIITAMSHELQWLLDNDRTNVAVSISFSWATPTVSDINAINPEMKRFTIGLVSMNYSNITNTDLPYACHRNGYRCKVWTVTTQNVATTMYERGVDDILVDASSYWNI